VPLVLDPRTLSRETLLTLVRQLRDDLAESRDLIRSPRGRVRDPSSLEAADALIVAALAVLDRDGGHLDSDALALHANLAYASLVAAIDLVKSHTDVPRVPAPRKPAAE
jgi:hypothetical protein